MGTVDSRQLKVSALTPQELQCLRLVAKQRSSKEIAAELGISKASVDTYCNRARAKLGVNSRRAAAILVMEAEAATPAVAAPVEANAPVAPPPPAAPAVTLFPPLSALGLWARLAVILVGAVVLALAFNMLLTGLQSLDHVLHTTRAAAARGQ